MQREPATPAEGPLPQLKSHEHQAARWDGHPPRPLVDCLPLRLTRLLGVLAWQVRLLTYRRAELLLSDHKPVAALLQVRGALAGGTVV